MVKCRCPSSYTIPAYIWAFLSIIAAIICPLGIYFSNWLEVENQDGTFDTVSAFRVCLNETARTSLTCFSYLNFDDIYSAEWKAVTLLMGIGGCCLVLVALTSLFGFCVKHLFNLVVMMLTLIFQALGTILFIISIILFPAGWDAAAVRGLCGINAGKFKIGDCSVGWAYIIIIIGTLIAVIATAMSWTTYRWKDKDDDDDGDPYAISA